MTAIDEATVDVKISQARQGGLGRRAGDIGRAGSDVASFIRRAPSSGCPSYILIIAAAILR